MRNYYLVRFQFNTPEAEEIGEPSSGELQIYADTAEQSIEITKRYFPEAWNFFVLRVVHINHLNNREKRKIENYICPQCGEDKNGSEIHTLTNHTYPPLTVEEAIREVERERSVNGKS